MARLILLERDTVLRDELAEFLAAHGHLVTVALGLDSFRLQWLASAFHLAIVDLGLPEGHGLNLIRELRCGSSVGGIIVYTANDQHRMACLDSGADHYLLKPMQFNELLSYVNSLSRRLGCDVKSETWVLDNGRRELASPDGEVVSLSARDHSVMLALFKGQGRLVSRRQVVTALGEDYLDFDQRRLDTQIRRLRVRSEKQFSRKLPINTVHGLGFVFAAPTSTKV